ncbi:MAG: hypothetical protein QHG99_01570, partial [Methanomicrobiales archaeon]|nr:hypothetical protein [Methanomicrobiales archaeon]
GTAANIGDIYRSIAGELKEVAGVDTKMNLSFENINRTYDNYTYTMDGPELFDYLYIDGTSTHVTSWNNTVNPLAGYPFTMDQRSEWNSIPPYLNFNVGNISINQTWQATFRLIPRLEGSISIFGPESTVSFNGMEGRYYTLLPDTFVTVIGNMSEEIGTQALVDVDITAINGSGMIDLDWVLVYNGTRTVKQDIKYKFSEDNVLWSSDWIPVESHYILFDVIGGPYNQNTSIDIRRETNWPMFTVINCSENVIEKEKGYIKFKVDAKELPNGDDGSDEVDACVQFKFGMIKIT